MKIALVLISIIVIVTLVIGGCAHRYKTPEERAEYFSQKITKKLDLNDEQQARLDTLKEEMLDIRKELQGKREDTLNTVRDLLNSARLDEDKALTVMNGFFDDFHAKAPGVIAALGSFWDSLGPEQQVKVREKMEKYFKHQGRCGHAQGHPM